MRAGAKGRRLLLVDDDVLQLKLNTQRLGEEGFVVHAVTSGQQALAMARVTPPDVVLSDVLMGEIDGFELCQLLRRDPKTAAVPIVLASAHCHGERERQLAAAVGAQAIVERSPDLTRELDALLRLLDAAPPVPSTPVGVDADGLHAAWAGAQLVRLSNSAQSAELWCRTLFEHSSDAISVLSTDGVILESNKRWEEILGWPTAHMIGRNIREFAVPDGGAENVAHYLATPTSGQKEAAVYPALRADGSIAYLAISNTPIVIDGETRVFAIGRDVSESIEAQRKLEASERRYRSLIESMPDGVWTSDLEGRMQFITANATMAYGYTPAEFLAMSVAERHARIHPEDVERLQGARLDVATGKASGFDIEFRFLDKGGAWVWIHSRGRVVTNPDGTRQVEGLLSNITERKLLQEQAIQSQKMEAVGQLTAGVAHDFNNILASIMSNAYFLMEGLALGDPRREDAAEIKLAAERAAALTRQLLAFSRKQVLAPAVLKLDSIVAGVERMLQRVIGEDIDLSITAPPHLGAVRADAGQIEQVLLNLAVNARDAMPRGGRLAIETTETELDASSAADLQTAPGRYVLLMVRDTGCGMNAATMKRIFEPFFTTKQVGHGTGLGLSTSYGIVKQSGGAIAVDSAPGRGTAFRIYLPLFAEPEMVATDSSPGPTQKQSQGTEVVLLIEDDDLVRSAVKRVLCVRGFRVLAARSGADALIAAKGHGGPIDLVLSDMIMPGESGPGAVALVRELYPAIKVLFISGYTEHPLFRDGVLEAGVNFLQKPFAPGELARRVREILDE